MSSEMSIPTEDAALVQATAYSSTEGSKVPVPPLIAEEDKIPLLQKLAFSIGVNTDYIATGFLTSLLWMPFFNIGMKINVLLLTAILIIYRLWDAVSDPVMGYISDRTKTRWGRRRPYMFIGAISCGLLFPFFWHMPSGLDKIGGVFYSSLDAWFALANEGITPLELGQAIYLTVFGLIFFTCFTMWGMSYYGLQLEMTPNYDERTRLSSWMAIFGKVSGLAGGWIMALITCDWFINPESGEPDLVIGMKSISWFIAASIIILGVLPAIFVKERYYKAVTKQKKTSFWVNVKNSLHCKPLWVLIGTSFFLVMGYASVSNLGTYINIYFIYGGDIAEASVLAGWRGTIVMVLGVASVPMWTWLGEKYDKRFMMIALLSMGIVGHLSNLFTMRPDMPYLQLLSAVFESCALSAVWLFIPSMKADTADYDELNTSERREGSINAFYSWFIKVSGTCSMGLGGYVLSVSGFDANLKSQPEEVLRYMFNMYLYLPAIIWGIALLIICFYPLKRSYMDEIRDTLEERRGMI